ncbi:hypothetical protein D3C76_1714870 [compost metagenome]
MPVLCFQNDLVERVVAGGRTQLFAYVLAVEHAGDLAQQLQVRIGGSFGDQQHEQQVNRSTVDGIEVYGGVKM